MPACDELGHRADGLFDRNGLVDAMLIVQVDVTRLQTLQRRVAGLADIVRLAVDPDPGPIFRSLVTEFGGDEELFALALDRPPDEPFVCERPVHVGGVEKVASQLERAMDGVD